MAQSHDTMMKPGIEGLLDRADSKFSLVTLAVLAGGGADAIRRAPGRQKKA